MQPYRAVCFDFDYTLADATDSIVAGFQHGFTKMGWPAPDRETVRGTIGYLLEDAYTMLTGDSDPARRAQFRPLFLEVAKERQRRETVLFPGAEELLRALHGHGVKTAIVSTKRGTPSNTSWSATTCWTSWSSSSAARTSTPPSPTPRG